MGMLAMTRRMSLIGFGNQGLHPLLRPISEVVALGQELERAIALAERIATAAPSARNRSQGCNRRVAVGWGQPQIFNVVGI